jgi:hypothetical protein
MIRNKLMKILLLMCIILNFACAYIVTPEAETSPTSVASKGWSAVVTNVQTSADGLLHIDLAIKNDTADWSAMQADDKNPAVLTTADGNSINCDKVFVSTGSHRIPPGFQMRGYTAGTKTAPKSQLLNVECANVKSAEKSKLTISYSYVTGGFNYYVASPSTRAKLDLNLDEVVKDLKYPVAEQKPDLIEKPGAGITAINKCELILSEAKRTPTGLEFSWDNSNPSQYPTYVHIGAPPVIGSDGVIYGLYESPNLADAPITPANGTSEWKTTVTAPQDVTGYYLLVTVESKQQRYFISHVIDITDK